MESFVSNNSLNIGRTKVLTGMIAELKELQCQFDELSAPLLTDLDLIPQLYDLFCRTFHHLPNQHQPYHRKKFIFVILYMYNPSVLVGGRLNRGLRKRISDVFGLHSPTPISDNINGIMMMYNYADFRRHVDMFYNRAFEYLENIGAV